MVAYLIQMCNVDGSTPLGRCPEYEINASDVHDARMKALETHHCMEIVSIGLKSQIEEYKRRWTNY